MIDFTNYRKCVVSKLYSICFLFCFGENHNLLPTDSPPCILQLILVLWFSTITFAAKLETNSLQKAPKMFLFGKVNGPLVAVL